MKTTVISSFKGGTAKTSTVLHLGTALAKFHKKKVLLIDFDPQANLSSGLGLGQRLEGKSLTRDDRTAINKLIVKLQQL